MTSPDVRLVICRYGRHTPHAGQNASVDVQRAAKFVTSSNTEEGFAMAMERFVLSTWGDEHYVSG